MHDAVLVLAPTSGEIAPTKHSLHLYIRSTVLNPSSKDPTNILVAIHRNTPVSDATNIPVKNVVSNITDAFLYIMKPISYEPKTMLLHLEFLKQYFINAAAT